MSITVSEVTDPARAAQVAAVAAATFPLACPPHSRPEDIAEFIRGNLDTASFRAHISAAESQVLVATTDAGDPDGATVVGYALLHHRAPADADVAVAVAARPASEVSKMYVLPGHHARGRADAPSALLMRAALDHSRARGSAVAWLGVNQENERAQRFYAKMGFHRVGTKTFDLNGSVEHDYVLAQPLG